MFDRRLTPLTAVRESALSDRTPPPDDYLSRLVKLLPAELVAGFTVLDTSFVSIEDGVVRRAATWAVIAAFAVMTWMYLAALSQVTWRRQLAVSSFTFVIWAASTSRTALGDAAEPAIVTAAVVLYTLMLPLVLRAPSERA